MMMTFQKAAFNAYDRAAGNEGDEDGAFWPDNGLGVCEFGCAQV